jgi:hypothetical protein
MAVYHVNAAGQTRPCGATVRGCPLGDVPHYETEAEAVKASMDGQGVPGLRVQSRQLRPASVLASRERKLFVSAQRVKHDVPVRYRTIASREEIYFNENGRESGNGVVVTRYRDGASTVRLPILYRDESGESRNVVLKLAKGESATAAFVKFRESVEYVPPETYRIIGAQKGLPVRAVMPTEYYARLLASLHASESVLSEPVESEAPASNNRGLLDALTEAR